MAWIEFQSENQMKTESITLSRQKLYWITHQSTRFYHALH